MPLGEAGSSLVRVVINVNRWFVTKFWHKLGLIRNPQKFTVLTEEGDIYTKFLLKLSNHEDSPHRYHWCWWCRATVNLCRRQHGVHSWWFSQLPSKDTSAVREDDRYSKIDDNISGCFALIDLSDRPSSRFLRKQINRRLSAQPVCLRYRSLNWLKYAVRRVRSTVSSAIT